MNITIWNNTLRNYPDVKDWIMRNAFFEMKEIDNKEFYVEALPQRYSNQIVEVIEALKGGKVVNLFHFLRLSTLTIDNDTRIHCDYTMGTQWAAILYFSTSPKWDKAEGTAFFRHKQYGKQLDSTNKELADDILTDDRDIKTKWIIDSIIGAKENRLLIYPCSYFHSRYPFKSWGKDKKTGRIIWVAFFDIEKEAVNANKR